MGSRSGTSSGMGLPGVLGVLFITLKLCKVIDWSWWWVLSPFWITGAILLLVVLVCAVLGVVGYLIQRSEGGGS